MNKQSLLELKINKEYELRKDFSDLMAKYCGDLDVKDRLEVVTVWLAYEFSGAYPKELFMALVNNNYDQGCIEIDQETVID